MVDERDLVFDIPPESHDHLYFGNLVYGGMVIDKTLTRKREDGIIERRFIWSPSGELIDAYSLKREKDATVQGFLIKWYPEPWIIADVTSDSKFGRRTFVLCDYRREQTKVMQFFNGRTDLAEDLMRRLHNAETKVIMQKKRELLEIKNPDRSFDKHVEQFKKFAEVIGYVPPYRQQQLPSEI